MALLYGVIDWFEGDPLTVGSVRIVVETEKQIKVAEGVRWTGYRTLIPKSDKSICRTPEAAVARYVMFKKDEIQQLESKLAKLREKLREAESLAELPLPL